MEAGGPKDIIDFAALLRPKLDAKASISLSNCYTAVGDENIAQLLAKQLPNVFVQGIDGELLDFAGLFDLWTQIGPAGGEGFPKVYQNGEVVPLGNLIRTHLGIYPR